MKHIHRNLVVSFMIYFAFASPFLSIYSLFASLSQQGNGDKVGHYHSLLSFYLANWPSILVKVYPTITSFKNEPDYDLGRGFYHPGVILINAIGWALIGGIWGLIWSGVLKTRKRLKPSSKK
jgi:Na+-driven multidrug efflux pump